MQKLIQFPTLRRCKSCHQFGQKLPPPYTKVAVNGAVMECYPVVFAQVGAYLFGTEFAADKGVDVLNQLRIELIGLSLTLFGQPALPLGLFGAVLLPLCAVPSDFAADGAFVAVKLFGDFGDGAVA